MLTWCVRHSDCWQWCLSHCVLLPFLRTDTHRRRRTKSKSSERVEGSDSTLSNQKGCCVEYNADVHLIQTTTKGAACNTMHVGQTITKGAACTTTPTMLLIPLFDYGNEWFDHFGFLSFISLLLLSSSFFFFLHYYYCPVKLHIQQQDCSGKDSTFRDHRKDWKLLFII